MDQVFIVVLKQMNQKVTFPCMLTMYFANPPQNTDVVAAMKDTLTKYRIGESDLETINEWIAFFEKQKFDYYASDLKYRDDVRNYTEQKLQFSLSTKGVYQGTPEVVETPAITLTIPATKELKRGK